MSLKKFNWEKLIKNRYNHLLLIFAVLFIVSPFLQAEGTLVFRPVVAFIYLLVVLAILRTIVLENKRFYKLTVLKVCSFGLELVAHFHLVPEAFEHPLHIVSRLVQIWFFFFFVWHLLRNIFSNKSVSVDTIKGGVCVYLLLGFAWLFIYRLLYEVNPQAFSVPFEGVWQIIYFSFATLTTLGYGDITPVSSFAMMLTSLEAMVGLLFVAIFVARLVGLNIAQSHSNHE
jgi:hypothetical protein